MRRIASLAAGFGCAPLCWGLADCPLLEEDGRRPLLLVLITTLGISEVNAFCTMPEFAFFRLTMRTVRFASMADLSSDCTRPST